MKTLRTRRSRTAAAETDAAVDHLENALMTGGRPESEPRTRTLRRRRWLDRTSWYEPRPPGIKSTTRQIEALQIAVAAPPSSPFGLILGQEASTGQAVHHDVFEAYVRGEISSPNVLVVGGVGNGKSSFLKTFAVMRNLLLGRRVVVIDKKLDSTTHEGEYALTARTFGVEPIRFALDGTGSRLNILDPAIAPTEGTGDGAPAGQALLLRAVLAEALGRPLLPKEGKALRLAHAAALRRADAEGRVPVLPDIVHELLHPDSLDAAGFSADELRHWGRDAAFELERLIHEDLAGLVDGPTSSNIRLDAGLTVFDVSALPETGPALSIVMTIINTWMMHMLAHQADAVPTVFVAEEGWHLMQGSVADVARRNWKLARGLGLSNFVALHHLSDVPSESPAIAMLKEAETIVLFGQGKDVDAEDCVRLFNLPTAAKGLLEELPQGTALIKIGKADPIVVALLRSDIEVALTNTDAAMSSRAVLVDDLSDLGVQ